MTTFDELADRLISEMSRVSCGCTGWSTEFSSILHDAYKAGYVDADNGVDPPADWARGPE